MCTLLRTLMRAVALKALYLLSGSNPVPPLRLFFFAQKKEPTAKTVGKFARLIADYSFTTRATSFAKAFLP